MPYQNETMGQGIPAPIDPWAHRSARMRCATCMWWVEKKTDGPSAIRTPEVVIGRCRRHAPSLGGFPVVTAADWCGDHRLDESRA